MKHPKIIFLLVAFAVLASCDKDDPKPRQPSPELPNIVVDQATIETNMVGRWEGTITTRDFGIENIVVTISEMKVAETVGQGAYYTSSLACGFEWTYELLDEGVVTFQENTLAPSTCFHDRTIKAHFENNKLTVMHLLIQMPGTDFFGTIRKQ